MPMSTVINAFLVLLPVLFVMALGFLAGRARQFDRDQVQGLNELVLTFALPALLFVGIVTTPRSSLLAAGPFVLALLIAFVGLFVVVAVGSRFVLHHRVGAAALQASCIVFSNVAFIGLPILTPLFGSSSTLSVAIAALVSQVTLVPLMVTMLEYDRQRSAGGETPRLAALVGQSLLSRPVVLAPLLATILVLLAVPVPKEIESTLNLIGSATAGVAVFVAGLIIAAYQVKVTVETAANTLVKMIVQPALMALLVVAFGIGKPLGSQAILICALPTAVVPAMFALRYKVYEAASTLLLTTIAMIVVMPLSIALTGA
ncbi:AEC family transporter [Ktedonobacter racemifer]|uniref:Auxin Efflux Carrier n=1 Tax=Ktedonobacter racemifer DSM 44963 TaxID=485913 RepID=D6U7Z8_KTERA|nr:AEC family transporter [Ktedonobacter racemifer]EFH80009.1 Auxin Efflux Carrier [Ktedonobacter racemifer DSM 44963]